MDSYLAIAKQVLQQARQPLSARQILKMAYQLQIVPSDLFGRSQHKTLQARLSTDILKHRYRSDFYRTAPGRFFLRTLSSDPSIPDRLRREFLAPLRAAQLGRYEVVSFPRSTLKRAFDPLHGFMSIDGLISLDWHYRQMDGLRHDLEHVPVRFSVVVISEGRALLSSNRNGDIGEFASRTSVGLSGVIKREDRSLFSTDIIGFPDAAIRTLIEQLDLPSEAVDALMDQSRWSTPLVFFEQREIPSTHDLFAVVSFTCAEIPAVTQAIDRISTLNWVPVPIRLNDLDGFDRWSSFLVSFDPLGLGATD